MSLGQGLCDDKIRRLCSFRAQSEARESKSAPRTAKEWTVSTDMKDRVAFTSGLQSWERHRMVLGVMMTAPTMARE